MSANDSPAAGFGGRVRQGIRRLLRLGFYRAGVFHLWRWANRDKIVILTLHGVVPQAGSYRWQPLRAPYPLERLEAALRVLARYYTFVSLADAVAMLKGERPFARWPIVMTLDDGYQNQFRHALPLFRKLGIPATFFVATGPVDGRQPYWFDRLDYAIQSADMRNRVLRIGGTDIQFAGGSRKDLASAYTRFRATAKGTISFDAVMRTEIERVTAELERQSGRSLADFVESDDFSAIASWDELAAARADTISEIGSHTVTHSRLGLVVDDVAIEELGRSRASLGSRLGLQCRYFCYPSGSYNERTPKLVDQAGYEAAVTSDPGLNDVTSDIYKLKRIALPDAATAEDLLYVCSGFSTWLGAVKPRARPKASAVEFGVEKTKTPA